MPATMLTGEVTTDQLIDAYGRGQRVFHDLEIVVDVGFPVLANGDLRGAQFLDCWLDSISFLQCDLTEVIFKRCNLKCTTFEKCLLRGAHWEQCAVCAVVLFDCDTSDMQASDLDAYGCHIEDASFLIEYGLYNAKRFVVAPPDGRETP